MRFIAVLVLLLPTIALADTFNGLSCHNCLSPKVNIPEKDGVSFCDKALHIVNSSRRPVLAILAETFGDDWTCVKRYLDLNRGRPHVLEIHISNETMRRRPIRQRGPEELFVAYGVDDYNAFLEDRNAFVLAVLKTRVLYLTAVVKSLQNANTAVWMSTGLEDNYTDKAAEVVTQAVREVWPGTIVRNPLGRGKLAGADLLESHSNRRTIATPGCVFNEDGRDNSLKQSKKAFKQYEGCLARMLWRKKHQGRDGSFKMPKDRKFSIPWKDVVDLSRFLGSL